MQFKVPQFLEIEDKIFGPFTFREFVYLAGGVGLCFIIYRAFGIWVGGLPIIIIGSLAAALTFYKPNNKPFIYMLESVFKYVFQDKLYIWKQREFTETKQEKINPVFYSPKNDMGPNSSKLRDLAWSLDVLDLNKDKQQ